MWIRARAPGSRAGAASERPGAPRSAQGVPPAWQRLKDITGHARGRQAFGGTRQLTCRRLMPRGSLVVAADGKHHVTHPMWSIGRAAALRHPPRVRLSNACRNRGRPCTCASPGPCYPTKNASSACGGKPGWARRRAWRARLCSQHSRPYSFLEALCETKAARQLPGAHGHVPAVQVARSDPCQGRSHVSGHFRHRVVTS